MKTDLAAHVRAELTGSILPYWERFARDAATGGFYGTIRDDNSGDGSEMRSIVMTARHLWAYSAASKALGDNAYLAMADYAYAAVGRDFVDRKSGGVFWSVRPDGIPAVARKQIYGEAFAIYGLAEYSSALGSSLRDGPVPDAVRSDAALSLALSIYDLLEERARDPLGGGYVEARAHDWSATAELKLSDKDIDCEKSMNTNLHVMEAYTTLARTLKAAPESYPGRDVLVARVEESLSSLVGITLGRILGADGHLDLYFNADWSPIGDIISYGHDIECSWLVWEALEELGNPGLLEKYRPVVVNIAEVALAEGVDRKTGALENETHGGVRERTRIWWCQAEALVGFFNAWQLTGDERFREAAEAQWDWIERFQRDPAGGDWFWAVRPDGSPVRSEPKGGNWKTSYHNARCCMEILRRLGALR